MTEFDPVLAMLEAAPIDDEPVTEDDRRHIAEGWEAYRTGRVISAEDIRQSLGNSELDQECAKHQTSLNNL